MFTREQGPSRLLNGALNPTEFPDPDDATTASKGRFAKHEDVPAGAGAAGRFPPDRLGERHHGAATNDARDAALIAPQRPKVSKSLIMRKVKRDRLGY